jgi:DNA-binding response OmpR family regulator
LSGLELVKKMRCARMTLPVILASGSLHTEELERQPWLQLAATLHKPFSPHQLLDTVKEVLGAATRASFGREGCGTALANTLRHHLPYQHGGSDAR